MSKNSNQFSDKIRSPDYWLPLLGGIALITLISIGRQKFLLFHIIAELFSIVIACSLFIIVWNTKYISENKNLLFLGTSYLFIGFIDLLHTIAYKGMGVFPAEWGANLPTQLWIIGRYFESLCLLFYSLNLVKKVTLGSVFTVCFGVTTVLLSTIFLWPIFPECYIEGSGLTSFKITSEYVICGILTAALLLLHRKRLDMNLRIYRYMVLAIIFTIGSELTFTFYVSVYGLSNLIGHLLKIVSFFLVYLALIHSGLTQPYLTLFKSLRESEEKYLNLFKNAQVGLFRFRVSDHQPTEMNEYFSSLLGYQDVEECLKDYPKNQSHALHSIYDCLHRYLSNETIVKNQEINFKHKDGSVIWGSLSGNYDINKNYIEGVIVDISKRKRQELVQRIQLNLINLSSNVEVDELLRHFLDEAERLTESKIGFFHFLEKDQEMITLQTWSTNTLKTACQATPETRHYPVSEAGIWTECIDRGKPVIHNDYACLAHKGGLPEGHVPLIRELVVPVIRSQKVVAILGVGNKHLPYNDRDIKTVQSLSDSAWEVFERRRAEIALQQAYEHMEQEVIERTKEVEMVAHKYKILFNTSQVGMMVLEEKRLISHCNHRTAEIFRYDSPEEMVGLSTRAFHFTDKSFKEFEEKYYNAVGGKVLHIEYEFRRKDNTSVWCSLSGKALNQNQPNDLSNGVLWIIDDISGRKRSEKKLTSTLKQLELSNEELSQFAYVASHDLQEPLRAIVGFLQLLESQNKNHLDEKALHYIERSVKATHRMQDLINDLLKLSRVNTRGREFDFINLNDIIAKIINQLGPLIEEKKVVIECEQLPDLMVDTEQIFLLIANLISNALKYNKETFPAVKIGTEPDGDFIRFYVQDNGIGINEKFFDRIFIVFQRLHARDEYSGTGIGLTLCKKIVERHGGKIWVESTEGAGSTFYFTLPLTRTNDD